MWVEEDGSTSPPVTPSMEVDKQRVAFQFWGAGNAKGETDIFHITLLVKTANTSSSLKTSGLGMWEGEISLNNARWHKDFTSCPSGPLPLV